MGFGLASMVNAKQLILRSSSLLTNYGASAVPKGYCAVYAGENQKKRFLIPITYLNHPDFRDFLCQAEEEYGFDHPMGGQRTLNISVV